MQRVPQRCVVHQRLVVASLPCFAGTGQTRRHGPRLGEATLLLARARHGTVGAALGARPCIHPPGPPHQRLARGSAPVCTAIAARQSLCAPCPPPCAPFQRPVREAASPALRARVRGPCTARQAQAKGRAKNERREGGNARRRSAHAAKGTAPPPASHRGGCAWRTTQSL